MMLDHARIKKRLQEKEAHVQRQIAELMKVVPTLDGVVETNEDLCDREEIAATILELPPERFFLVNAQVLLTEVQVALQHCVDGIYGRCIVCGRPISDARLEAIPWATYCLKDETALEQSDLSRASLDLMEIF